MNSKGFSDLNLYLGHSDDLASSQQKDDEQLRLSALMNDLSNIRQTQQSYGIPAIGDLFRAKPDDIAETINSIYYMLKQRVADLDFRQEARQKWGKIENEKQEFQDQNNRLKQRIDQLQTELKDVRLQLTNQETKFKQEKDKFSVEREDLNKTITRLISKETQFKHELKNKDLQIEKFKESYRQKMFEKANKQQINGTIDAKDYAPLANAELKFSRIGGDSDFNLMIAKNQEEIQRRLSEENQDLKECLKQLQKELFDVVDLKTEIYLKRYRAEYPQQTALGANGLPEYESEEIIRSEIERIREELFNLPFEESGREIIAKFQQNFSKLREFMEKVDKEIAQLSVFNDKAAGDINDFEYDNQGLIGNNKFNGITSVQQLKHLLRNYDALVEGQHQLLNQSINKMAKIPPPDEISSTFSRFQILKDSELDEMRNFLNEHKLTMQQQYKDFDQERRQFDEMTYRMEQEKLKISEDRERIEAEVRKIKELNQQLSQQLFVTAK